MLLDERAGLANLVHTKRCLYVARRSGGKAGGGNSTHGINDTDRTTA
jgi:hypothetical protein